MLIGIDASRTTASQPTGTEAYSLALSQALLKLHTPHRWRLYFAQQPPKGVWPSSPDVALRVISCPRLWTHLGLSAEMLVAPPDVLFVPAHVLPLVLPRHTVVTVHDLGYHYFPDAHTWAARRYLELTTRRHARLASLVLADSKATRDDLVRVYGAPPNRVRVVYPGRREEIGKVADRSQIDGVRHRLGLAGSPYILYVGTLQPRKNLVRLIEAYARVRASWSGPDPIPLLVLAGRRGWLSDPIFHTVDRLGLGGSVRFPGYIRGADLPALLSDARVFCFPSLYEGFGFPILEAMACDVPVVCSDTSSLPEVAGQAALLIDALDVDRWADAITRTLTDTGLRRRLVAAGREQITRFSWKNAASETLTLLEEAGQLSDRRGLRDRGGN